MKNNCRILFIGDSITECGRKEDPENIGTGYVKLVHDYLIAAYPSNTLKIMNRGISGDRITDLAARWEQDVLALNPDYLSISIGINDVWRQLDHPEMEQVYPDQFEAIYRDLLQQVREKTDAVIFLMEPTIIEENTNAEGNLLLKKYVKIIHQLGKEFETYVVPTHEAFIDFLHAENGNKLTSDGVHMNSIGNMLMTKTWLKTFTEIKA